MGIGPIPATKLALEKAGLTIDQIDVIELNEAFASQALACMRELGMDPEKVNIYGGAIALGHPVSASGGVLINKLLYSMKDRNARYGLATLCIGGGQGLALILERKQK
jgi:acetyl-CoA C-acetyltransferase